MFSRIVHLECLLFRNTSETCRVIDVMQKSIAPRERTSSEALLPDSLAFRQQSQHVTRYIVRFARATGSSCLAYYRLFPAIQPSAHFSPAVRVTSVKYRHGFRKENTNIAHGKKPRAFYRAHKWEEAARHGANSRHRILQVDVSMSRSTRVRSHLSIVCSACDINRTRDSTNLNRRFRER